MRSYLSHLECTETGETYNADEPHTLSPAAQKVLYPRYDLDAVRRDVDPSMFASRPPTIWRYFELMPVRDESKVVSLGEGGTPMMRASNLERSLDARTLYIKDEGQNPTGTFKARGLSSAVSRAKELGLTRLTAPSAGNAGGALASYCARGSMECYVFMPEDAPASARMEAALAGSHLTLVKGLINEAGRLSREKAAELSLFDVSTLREPYRVEGKKTMGYEIAQDLAWRLPEAIVYPTGGGMGLVAMWKAFDEMERLGWIGPERPKMIVVQSTGCAPIVRAFEQGVRHAEPWENAQTIAAGIRVPAAVGDYLILDAVRESGGTAIAVTDEEILAGMREMASAEGVWSAPEGAATLVAYRKLRESGFLAPETETVLIVTGAGTKYTDVAMGA